MSVRTTEKRIPAGFSASDLGQDSAASDDKSVLVSYLSNPLVLGRTNHYVVFVTDSVQAGQVSTYEWVYEENSVETRRQTSNIGTDHYTPQAEGTLNVTVSLGGTPTTISMNQQIVAPNAELETLIDNARNESGPVLANPQVARELVNDFNSYYRNIQPASGTNDEGFYRLLFDQVYDGSLKRSADDRKRGIEQMSNLLNGDATELDRMSNIPLGVCGIRMTLLAMVLLRDSGSSYLPWTELPENTSEQIIPLRSLQTQLDNLSQEEKVDLFNILRFPKSNIRVCGKILEALRDRYFNGTSFSDVRTGFEGARLNAIVKHFNKGPILRT